MSSYVQESHPVDDPPDPLTEAAVFAGQAPSIHNTQPWLWRLGDDVVDLRLQHARVLRSSDPQARLAVLSCGAALHHARIHLAARGWRVIVHRLADPADPDHLARLVLNRRVPVEWVAARLVEAAARRYTDRRTAPSAPLDFHKLRSIGAAVQQQGAALQLLRPNQIFALANAAERAQRVEAEDPGRVRELADWLGGVRAGTGIPDAALPYDPLLLTAPGRALRRAGAALIAESHHHASVFAVLHGPHDRLPDWLVAGEALSAGWLTATRLDVSVLPLSVVVEVAGSREMVRRLLRLSGHPYLVLRFAAAEPDGERPASAPRLPSTAIIETAVR
jgi:hypothetical protein